MSSRCPGISVTMVVWEVEDIHDECHRVYGQGISGSEEMSSAP